MRYFQRLPEPARTVAIAASGVLALLFLLLSLGVVSDFFSHNQKVRQLEPKVARIKGYTTSAETLRESNARMREQLAQLAFESPSDGATAGARVQQQLRSMADGAGLKVTGSQLLEPRKQQGFEEMRVDLKFSGPMEALETLLLELHNTRPLLLVRSMNLMPERGKNNSRRKTEDAAQIVTGTINISAVRLP